MNIRKPLMIGSLQSSLWRGPGGSMSQVVGLPNISTLSSIRRWFAPGFVNYKGCTRLATASDKGYQLLAQGRWFTPGTPASSTTKAGRHDIAEILLKVALNTINPNKKICTLEVLDFHHEFVDQYTVYLSHMLNHHSVLPHLRHLLNFDHCSEQLDWVPYANHFRST